MAPIKINQKAVICKGCGFYFFFNSLKKSDYCDCGKYRFDMYGSQVKVYDTEAKEAEWIPIPKNTDTQAFDWNNFTT
jgi:hypothetical protein